MNNSILFHLCNCDINPALSKPRNPEDCCAALTFYVSECSLAGCPGELKRAVKGTEEEEQGVRLLKRRRVSSLSN